jgi:hypothetical protein
MAIKTLKDRLNTIKTNLKTNLFLFLFSGYVVLESSVKLKNEWSEKTTDLYMLQVTDKLEKDK